MKYKFHLGVLDRKQRKGKTVSPPGLCCFASPPNSFFIYGHGIYVLFPVISDIAGAVRG